MVKTTCRPLPGPNSSVYISGATSASYGSSTVICFRDGLVVTYSPTKLTITYAYRGLKSDVSTRFA